MPFDLRLLRILIYDTKSPHWATQLQERIKNSLLEILESPTDSILTAFLKIRPNIEETDSISAELIEIKQLLLSQITNTKDNIGRRKISVETLMEASVEAKKLYYDDGWDISDIKNHLMEKYGFSAYTADDVFHRLL